MGHKMANDRLDDGDFFDMLGDESQAYQNPQFESFSKQEMTSFNQNVAPQPISQSFSKTLTALEKTTRINLRKEE